MWLRTISKNWLIIFIPGHQEKLTTDIPTQWDSPEDRPATINVSTRPTEGRGGGGICGPERGLSLWHNFVRHASRCARAIAAGPAQFDIKLCAVMTGSAGLFLGALASALLIVSPISVLRQVRPLSRGAPANRGVSFPTRALISPFLIAPSRVGARIYVDSRFWETRGCISAPFFDSSEHFRWGEICYARKEIVARWLEFREDIWSVYGYGGRVGKRFDFSWEKRGFRLFWISFPFFGILRIFFLLEEYRNFWCFYVWKNGGNLCFNFAHFGWIWENCTSFESTF